MKFYTTIKSITSLSADTLVVFAGSDTKSRVVYLDDVTQIDASSKGRLKKLLKLEEFEPTVGSTFVFQTHGVLPYTRIIVSGCSDVNRMTSFDWQTAVAAAAARAKQGKTKTLSLAIPQEIVARLGAFAAVRLAVEGIGLGTYAFLQYKNKKTQDKDKDIETVTFFITKEIMHDTVRGIVDGTTRTSGTMLARDLVNEPSSVATPSYLGKVATSLAKHPRIRATVYGKKEIKKFGMHAFLGVSKGSNEEPKFIKLTYHGGGTSASSVLTKKTICLVGKGITYDSGGLSLKNQSGLETMKCDMAGAAAILGVFQALFVLKPSITVVGLIAACENMPSGTAIKPGDIVRAMNGKTIEVVNTDAEGRLVLADALSYAEKYVPSDYIIDVATLTGACVVALGEDIAGVFSDDDMLARSLLDAGLLSGEKLWRLPIAKEYQDELKSAVADVRNVSKTKYGGAINGALFLKEFVKDATVWAHLDIAGPAFAEKETPLTRYGGTGFGVRTLVSFIEAQAKKM
ncbi:MAG: leucyl aminopeptidase [Candidatus Gottesmanbacteria bacterium]